jgi:uncharacterized protein YjbI with pentapeptide repeats
MNERTVLIRSLDELRSYLERRPDPVRCNGVMVAGADLSNADLSGLMLVDMRLEGVVLKGANLENAYMQGTEMENVDLRGAVMNGSQMRYAAMRSCDLTGAKLRKADLDDTKLNHVTLTGVDVTEGRMTDAELEDCVLDGLIAKNALCIDMWLKRCSLKRGSFVVANLFDAWIEDCDLSDCDFSGADLRRVGLIHVDARRASFIGCTGPFTIKHSAMHGVVGFPREGLHAEALDFSPNADGSDIRSTFPG